MNQKHFVVINCLSQGFAVAGPCECGARNAERGVADYEMVVWGLAADKAVAMAKDLNEEAKLERTHD